MTKYGLPSSEAPTFIVSVWHQASKSAVMSLVYCHSRNPTLSLCFASSSPRFVERAPTEMRRMKHYNLVGSLCYLRIYLDTHTQNSFHVARSGLRASRSTESSCAAISRSQTTSKLLRGRSFTVLVLTQVPVRYTASLEDRRRGNSCQVRTDS